MADAIHMDSTSPSTASKHSEPSDSGIYRLLYRGALSLPDSHLLLDGLTFAARLDTSSKNNHLLRSPLALALESMRGRPSLRFVAVVTLKENNMFLDENGGVELDIHPNSYLTRVYFENTFCLRPFTSSSESSTYSDSDVGIRVALGDTDGPDTTEILIFARALKTAASNNRTLQLRVARIAPCPVVQLPLHRVPRPDDPTPRRPPAYATPADTAGKRTLTRTKSSVHGLALAPAAGSLKRSASLIQATNKRQRFTNDGSNTAALGRQVRLGNRSEAGVFKIPEVPSKSEKVKAKTKPAGLDDVFDSQRVVPGSSKVTEKKVKESRHPGAQLNNDDKIVNVEDMNKIAIKKVAVEQLAALKNPNIDKTHPEYKELLGYIYRGVRFALRACIRHQLLEIEGIDRLVKKHIEMYANGWGDLGSDGR